jgi:hypothetical protein
MIITRIKEIFVSYTFTNLVIRIKETFVRILIGNKEIFMNLAIYRYICYYR